jgi:hypothetical protein
MNSTQTNRRALPGFTAEIAVEFATTLSWCGKLSAASDKVENTVTPSSRACKRLLKVCISGPDPRSYACDYWLLHC